MVQGGIDTRGQAPLEVLLPYRLILLREAHSPLPGAAWIKP